MRNFTQSYARGYCYNSFTAVMWKRKFSLSAFSVFNGSFKTSYFNLDNFSKKFPWMVPYEVKKRIRPETQNHANPFHIS